MYVWEMIAFRLRNDGWLVHHEASRCAGEESYTVYYQRRGVAGRAGAPTLTEAYAEASRQARSHRDPAPGPQGAPSHLAPSLLLPLVGC